MLFLKHEYNIIKTSQNTQISNYFVFYEVYLQNVFKICCNILKCAPGNLLYNLNVLYVCIIYVCIFYLSIYLNSLQQKPTIAMIRWRSTDFAVIKRCHQDGWIRGRLRSIETYISFYYS